MSGNNFSSLTPVGTRLGRTWDLLSETWTIKKKKESSEHTHHKAHMHVCSNTDKNTKDLTFSNMFCSRTDRMGGPLTILFLSCSHSHFSLLPQSLSSCCRLTTLDYFFHTLSTPAPPCLLSYPFSPSFALPLSSSLPLFFSSVANHSWTFPWWRAAILHHNITWSRGQAPPILPPQPSYTRHNHK